MLLVFLLDKPEGVGVSFQGLLEKRLEDSPYSEVGVVAVAKVEVADANRIGRLLTEGLEMLNDKRSSQR